MNQIGIGLVKDLDALKNLKTDYDANSSGELHISLGAFHSTKNSGNSGWKANGEDIFRNLISEF